MLRLIGAILGLLAVVLVAATVYIRINRGRRLAVLVSAPDRVRLGADCRLEIRIVNPTRSPQVLDFLDIENSLLGHFELIGVLPHAKSKAEALGSTWIHYKKEMPAGESIAVEVHLRPVRIGRAAGGISAINSRLLGKRVPACIEVVEATR